jgi:hypothetical protein
MLLFMLMGSIDLWLAGYGSASTINKSLILESRQPALTGLLTNEQPASVITRGSEDQLMLIVYLVSWLCLTGIPCGEVHTRAAAGVTMEILQHCNASAYGEFRIEAKLASD